MSIDAEGWVDWANQVRPPLAPQKRYPEDNAGEGIVWHSQEGYGYAAMQSILLGPRQTSFMFWTAKNGRLVQFAPVTWSTWTSGSKHANTHFWSNELEGIAGEPINDVQLATALRLIEEWKVLSGDSPERRRTMWEHREVATRWMPNAGPTACPSERYARLWAALEVDDMTAEQIATLEEHGRQLGEVLHRLDTLTDLLRATRTEAAETAEIATRALATANAVNDAMVQRLDLLEVGVGPIKGVRAAAARLEAEGLLPEKGDRE